MLRRLLFACLLVVLVGLPVVASTARAASTRQILQDCYEDDTLNGTYTVAELQKARNNLPTDVDEYSGCRDVLATAISSAAARANQQRSGTATPSGTSTPFSAGGGGSSGSSGSDGSSGSTGSGSSGSGGQGTDAEPTPSATPTPTPAPVTAEELDAVARAAQKAGIPSVEVDGRRVVAASSGLAPDAVVNALPTSMLVVLILLAATAVAAILPFLRRRVLRRHRPE